MDKILQKKQVEICKDILKIIDNERVNVEIDENCKNSLYVFLNNTIYISNKTNNKKNVDEQNKSKVLVIAHECAHSIQSKLLQIVNFILANLEMILFAAVIIARVFFFKYNVLLNTYLVVSLLSITVRWYLEMNATINSVKIASSYMLQNGVAKEQIKELIKYYKKELLKTLPIFLIWLFIFRIIRLILVLVI